MVLEENRHIFGARHCALGGMLVSHQALERVQESAGVSCYSSLPDLL